MPSDPSGVAVSLSHVTVASRAATSGVSFGVIEGLRALRLMHHSAWIARRWDDPAFPLAFPWFAGERYWGDQILALREQMAALDEEPLRLF